MSSSSREGSPDWLRSFQAPTTTSLLSLSSSDDSPCRESETISSLPVTGDGDAVVTILDKESSESLSKKDSKTKLVTKQVSIEQVFSRRKKKVDASLDLEEKESGNEVDGEENSSKQKDAKEGDDYVWFVSSDSEPPSSEPVSQQVTMATVKDEDIVIQPKEGEPAVKKAQKKKISEEKGK